MARHRIAAAAAAARPLVLLLLVLLLLASAAATRLAIIGDFGDDSSGELDVSNMVKAWDAASPLEAIATVGDNNYPSGLATTIQANIGKYYGAYIKDDPAVNKFWPCPGNHDWGNQCRDGTRLQPYLDYFKALKNKRYYDVKIGADLHLFMLDSDCNEPDGRTASSAQAAWLQGALAASAVAFKLVLLHHAPFSSSSKHGSNKATQWPYEEWGADAVFAGHDHTYERHSNPRNLAGKAGFPYFVNGLGGKDIYGFKKALPSTQFRYNAMHGAQLLVTRSRAAAGGGTEFELDLTFHSSDGTVQDCYRITKAPAGTSYTTGSPACPAAGSQQFSVLTSAAVPAAPAAPTPAKVWRYLGTGKKALSLGGSNPWTSLRFGDSAWSSGPSPLGYGPGLVWGTQLPANAPSSGTGYYHFRTTVCLPASLITQLGSAVTLKLASDKRAKVWVNRQLVASEPSKAGHPASHWNLQTALKPAALVAGPNVIAVQVANTAGASSTGFDLDLTYFSTQPFTNASTVCP